MLIPHHAMWKHDVNSVVDALVEGGLYKKLMDDHVLYREARSAQAKRFQYLLQNGMIPAGDDKFDPKTDSTRKPLTPMHFASSVWLWCGGIFLASIVFLWELLRGAQLKKKVVVVA